jgi:hypothetical protein
MPDPIAAILSFFACPGKLKVSEEKASRFEKFYEDESKEVNKLKEHLRQAKYDKLVLSDQYKKDINGYRVAIKEIEKSIRFFKELWQAAINVPVLKDLLTKHVIVEPRKIPLVLQYAREIADNEYYAYTLSIWYKILERTHKEVKEELPIWIASVSDCDNFAEATAHAVRAAFIKEGKKRQAAIGWARSATHAYNWFITNLGECYIYEPQNGSIKGKLGETDGIYLTTKIYIMG